MTSFLRQRNVDLVESPWQIIQVICTVHSCTCRVYNCTIVYVTLAHVYVTIQIVIWPVLKGNLFSIRLTCCFYSVFSTTWCELCIAIASYQPIWLPTNYHALYCHAQIADTSTPGEFNVWILIGNNMDQVKLCIPRVFYVNSRTERNANETSAAWRSVSKSLPRSVPHINLYEYTVPETIFKEHTGLEL